ncbi:hypothetical protein Tco_0993380 [Tanacetum coccineum]|uniref:Uncharacterized protein n=1 Tax=Tanacetum coccineum TaxID=301880 RepID=A0ABQ5F4Q8_9ASTR
MEGLYNVEVKYIGGLEVIVILQTEEAVKNVVENTNHGVRRWLWRIRRADALSRSTGRLTWVSILRVPMLERADSESVGKPLEEDEVLVEDTLKVWDDLVKDVEPPESDPFVEEDNEDEDDKVVEQTAEMGDVHRGNGGGDREEDQDLGLHRSKERCLQEGCLLVEGRSRKNEIKRVMILVEPECIRQNVLQEEGEHQAARERFIIVKGSWKGLEEEVVLANIYTYHVTGKRKNSDHCPIVLKDTDLDFRPKPFMAFDFWLEDGEIESVFRTTWAKPVRGSRLDCLLRAKFKNVKEALKVWSKSKFGNTKHQLNLYKIKAMKWEMEAETRNIDKDELRIWMEAHKVWFDKENEMNSNLKQKARIKWDI